MGERFSSFAGAIASGTNKTLIDVYNGLATPTRRARIYDLIVGCDDTPGDQAARFVAGRTTAIGSGGSAYTPNNIDPGGPAGECTSYVGPTSEPTYTANKELLVFSLNQRATFRWMCAPGGELLMAATQNNGIGLKTTVSTSTQAYEATVFHEE